MKSRISNTKRYELSADLDALNREAIVWANYLENVLSGTPQLSEWNYFPILSDKNASIEPVDQLISKIKDGVMLAHLAFHISPSSIQLSQFAPTLPCNNSRNTIRFSSANFNSSSGPEHFASATMHQRSFEAVAIVNTLLMRLSCVPFKITATYSAQNIVTGDRASVLGLLWSLIRLHSLSPVSLNSHPQLIWLGPPSELVSLDEEVLLLKWVNYHLDRSGVARRVNNFGSDFADCVAFAVLTMEIAPELSDREVFKQILDLEVPSVADGSSLLEYQSICEQRADLLLDHAQLLGLSEVETIHPCDVAHGCPRTILLFVASLFRHYIGIMQLPSEDELLWLNQDYQDLTEKLSAAEKKVKVLEDQSSKHTQIFKERLNVCRQEMRNEALANELQLYNRIDDLETLLDSQETETEQKVQTVNSAFQEFRGHVSDTIGLTDELLRAYQERREQMFAGANMYNIRAFNNEGKRIEFQIPAPALGQKCDFDCSSLGVEQHNMGEAPPTPTSDDEAREMEKDLKRATQASQRQVEISTASRSDRSMRPRTTSAPPDVYLDRESFKTSTQSFVDTVELRKSLQADAYLASSENMVTRHVPVVPSSSASSSVDGYLSIHSRVCSLIEENMQQVQQIQLLAAKVDEMSWLNQTMGDKVRQFSEEMILGKTGDRLSASSSKLKNFFK